MAKNMIRKSLAIASGLALTSAVLVAAPAQAAITKLELSPALGTGTQTVLGATFNLKLLHVGGSSSDSIEYFVTGAKAANITAEEGSGITSLTSIPTIATGLTEDAVSNDDKTANINGGALEAGKYDVLSIKLDATEITETTTITVTPFLDTVVANDEIEADEVSGNTLSITFNLASGVTPTVTTLTPTAIGAGSGNSTAVVTLDSGINMVDTVGALQKVDFKENGGTADSDTTLAYSITDGGYAAEDATGAGNAGGSAYADGDVLSAQAFIIGDTATGGPVKLAEISEGTVATMNNTFTINAGNSYLASDNSDGSNTTTDSLRAGSGTVEIVATVTAAVSPNSIAGQPVVFEIDETTDGSFGGATITAGGKTLTDATDSVVDEIEVTVLTDALGEATLSLSYSDLDNKETFDVSAVAIGADAETVSDRKFTASNSYTSVLVSDVDGGDGSAASYQVAAGGNGSITYYIRDQFGQVPTGTFRAKASVQGGAAAAVNKTIAFSGGQSTLSWTDTHDAANASVSITMDLEKLNTAGTAYANVAPAATHTDVLVDVVAEAITPTRVTATNSGDNNGTGDNEAILKEAYVTGDERWEASSKAWNTDGSILDDITGTVYSTTGGSVPGALVTVSAPGVLFTNQAKTVYSQDSITVRTARDGGYVVFYASNTVGEKTFTITSGSGSATFDETFDGVDEVDATAISISAPSNVLPGSTVTAIATVTDQFGNPVTIDAVTSGQPEAKFSYSGPGLTVGTAPVISDVNGQMKLSILMGSNDSGTGTFTATYDKDGDGVLTEVDGGNVVTTQAITIGETPVEQKVNAGSFKGYVAVYARGYEGQRLSAKIGNDWVIVDPIVNNQENGTLHRTVDFTGAGYDIAVRIYIDRVLLDTINLTTK